MVGPSFGDYRIQEKPYGFHGLGRHFMDWEGILQGQALPVSDSLAVGNRKLTAAKKIFKSASGGVDDEEGSDINIYTRK